MNTITWTEENVSGDIVLVASEQRDGKIVTLYAEGDSWYAAQPGQGSHDLVANNEQDAEREAAALMFGAEAEWQAVRKELLAAIKP